MKQLSQDIKRMLSAFAYEDAGEFLSLSDKYKLLETNKQQPGQDPEQAVSVKQVSIPSTPRVAILFDGYISEAILNYVLNESSHMENTDFDVVAYGEAENLSQQADVLCARLQESGRNASVTMMLGETTELFNKFTSNNPALGYIVATEHDHFVKKILANSITHHYACQLPLILIQDAPHKKQAMISAA